MRQLILVLFFILAVSSVFAGCSGQSNTSLPMGHSVQDVGNDKGDVAPDFSVKLIDGTDFKLSDYKGEKPVLLYFWATWCPYCKEDFSVVKNVYPKYKDGVEFLAMDLDSSEDIESIKEYVNKMGLHDIKFTTAQSSVLVDYGVHSTTTKYAIGRNGLILWKGSGAVDEETWETIFTGLKNS